MQDIQLYILLFTLVLIATLVLFRLLIGPCALRLIDILKGEIEKRKLLEEARDEILVTCIELDRYLKDLEYHSHDIRFQDLDDDSDHQSTIEREVGWVREQLGNCEAVLERFYIKNKMFFLDGSKKMDIRQGGVISRRRAVFKSIGIIHE